MYSIANGTKTISVITSCRIFSCARLKTEKPMRLAGTCIRYSKSAIPQLMKAAIHHALEVRFLRCPYQANVMKRFEPVSRSVVATTGGTDIECVLRDSLRQRS